MRTRNKKLSDYGVPSSDEEKLYKLCRNASGDVKDLLDQAAHSSCSCGLALCVLQSLTENKSYNEMTKVRYIPAGPDDFYAYRRKTVAKFYDLLRMYGKWDL